ncbi:MAG: arginine decarboxylase [Planctomycetota bacterium]|jgi:arginine decarboxylase
MSDWSHLDSEELYHVANWGGGYFRVSPEGNVVATPNGSPEGGLGSAEQVIDLREVIEQIRRRGVDAPLLLRFDGILRARLREITGAFNRARHEYGYDAPYSCVYPIKVNQQRHLLDVLIEESREQGLGLEVGSKPELIAVMSLFSGAGRTVVCNGYKDREYVELALLTSHLGTRVILVIEKISELKTILSASKRLGITPVLGVRTKLGGVGSGRWKESGGDRSKFGLTTRQIVQVVESLRSEGMLDCLQLLHYHLGSQITRIRSIKNALNEATRTLVGLVAMGANIRYFDVGGGLGVDYDGSQTDFESSMNYSVQEYANDVVSYTQEACAEAGIPQPTLFSESGRALTAHHAVLVAEVCGVTDFSTHEAPEEVEDSAPQTLRILSEVHDKVTTTNVMESYHDALELRDEVLTLFNVGQLSLPDRARADELFWRTCQRIQALTREMDYVPEDLSRLAGDLADTYFVNFSIFQSMPDSWAIGQLFPVLPLQRLTEEPTRRAVLVDVTCDSDGKIDKFIDLRGVKHQLELHPVKEDEPYYLGFFLVGAYQEILGDMHNLFGDTHVVHVDVTEDGKLRFPHFISGDKIEEVLSYVEYFRTDLMRNLRNAIETAIDEDRISLEQSATLLRTFKAGLASYTYLINDEPASGDAVITPQSPREQATDSGAPIVV